MLWMHFPTTSHTHETRNSLETSSSLPAFIKIEPLILSSSTLSFDPIRWVLLEELTSAFVVAKRFSNLTKGSKLINSSSS